MNDKSGIRLVERAYKRNSTHPLRRDLADTIGELWRVLVYPTRPASCTYIRRTGAPTVLPTQLELPRSLIGDVVVDERRAVHRRVHWKLVKEALLT